VCGSTIDLVATKPSHWRADHIVRHAEGGKEVPDNLWPICIDCDAGKDGKAAEDTKTVAHGKRMGNRHDGVKLRGWR
jgi:5-methylcytosine-specific restriction endonuclease McrA